MKRIPTRIVLCSRKVFVKIALSPITYIVIALVVLCVFEFGPDIRLFLTERYEDVSYTISPSAEKAFKYGERHFNAIDPGQYDVPRAQLFFERAAELDPHLMYVWHELARIAFLHGDFIKAHLLIDKQIALEGDATPNSYYVRGLIEGYQGEYNDAQRDYAHFLTLVPASWPGTNDLVWILLKNKNPQLARSILAVELQYFPRNPWLLNSYAIALYETGSTTTSIDVIKKAQDAVATMSTDDWLRAYPGNDPTVAATGIANFRRSVDQNRSDIENGRPLQE